MSVNKALHEGMDAFNDGKSWRDNPYRHRFWNTVYNRSRWMWWHTGYQIAKDHVDVYNKE